MNKFDFHEFLSKKLFRFIWIDCWISSKTTSTISIIEKFHVSFLNRYNSWKSFNLDNQSKFDLHWNKTKQNNLQIGKPSARRNILMDCGIHAREFISPATCLYMIDKVCPSNQFIWLILLLFFFFNLVYRRNQRKKSVPVICV